MKSKLHFSELGRRQQPSEITRLMTLALERPDILSLAAGFTDQASLPLENIQQIVAGFTAEDRSLLQYGANQGLPSLRKRIAQRVGEMDGVMSAIDPDLTMITNGSQQSLYLAMQTLCDPGDIVLVEQPTYFVFLEILAGLGIEAAPMPMKENGDIDTDGLRELIVALEAEGRGDRIKALYMVSYFANPTGHSVSEECKRSVASLLSECLPGCALIEDAAYRELYYEDPFDSPSLFSLEESAGLSIFYTSTLTKPYVSGLKVGYGICSDRVWLEKMLDVKGQHDFGTAHLNQAIVDRSMDGGAFDGHLLELRSIYKGKMQCLDETLRQGLPELGWKWSQPAGGLYLWLEAPCDTGFESDFHDACIQEGVMYVPGALCSASSESNSNVRLSFGVLDLGSLRRAGALFCQAVTKTYKFFAQ